MGVGGVKRKHKSISTSDTEMVDVYEGRGIFNSEPTTILLSGTYIFSLAFWMRQLVVDVIVFETQ